MTKADGKVPLTEQMRKATRTAHKISDAVVLSKLVTVLTDKVVYAKAISSFYPIYKALETKVFKHRDLPQLAPVAAIYDKIQRTAAIESDLEYFLGPKWQDHVVMNPAVEQYLQHLDSIEQDHPALLLGFAYGLHFVALFGPLGRRIKKTLQLEGSDGVRMYTLEGSGSLLKDLKSAVNAAGETLDPVLRERVIEQGIKLYTYNNSVVQAFSPGAYAYLKAPVVLVQSLPTWFTVGALGVGVAAVYWHMRS